MSAALLDLRGLRCPWPALRVARALRETTDEVIAVADDPLAAGEIAAVAAAQARRITPAQTPIGAGWRIGAIATAPSISTKG